jgi:hypothetical protein
MNKAAFVVLYKNMKTRPVEKNRKSSVFRKKEGRGNNP